MKKTISFNTKIYRIALLLIFMFLFLTLPTYGITVSNHEYVENLLEEGESTFAYEYESNFENIILVTKKNGNLQVQGIDNFLENVKYYKYKNFVESQGSLNNAFSNLKINSEEFKDDEILSNQSIYNDNIISKLTSTSREEKAYYKILIEDEAYKFVLPISTFQFDYRDDMGNEISEKVLKKEANETPYKENLNRNTMLRYVSDWNILKANKKALLEIKKNVQEGIIAGSIETSYNIGTIYSDKQVPLKDVMEENVEDEKIFFRFKDTVSLKASLDYVYNPLFGEMSVTEGIPSNSEEWNEKAYTINLQDGDIKINSGYKSFVKENSPERVNLKEVNDNLNFTNGIEEYSHGNLVTGKPKKLVNYNMRIVVPKKFIETGIPKVYGLAEGGMTLIPNKKMSVYNDTIYDFSEEEPIKVCTNEDIDLQRDHLMLYKQIINGEPIGVVVVLKFSEVVANTTEGNEEIPQKFYYTGRDIILNNNYSNKMELDVENENLFSSETPIYGKMGIKSRFFSFEKYPTDNIEEFAFDKINHSKLSNDSNEFHFIIDFRGDKIAEDIATTEESEPLGFVIIRNNTYSQSKVLLDWLSTSSAESISYVKAEKLQKLLKGEFGAGEVGFSQWKNIQRIKNQLAYDKGKASYSFINVTIMIVGVFLIVLGVAIIFIYFLDIMNALTDFSILEFISRGRLYPVASNNELEYLKNHKQSKFITLKGILFISVVLWTIGGLFLENYLVFKFFAGIYTELMELIGGGA